MIKMDEQDYEYYEARAKDVKLENITSSQHNADVLERLRDNDPDFTQICIADESQDEGDFVAREGDDLGWLGYFVGNNEHLEGLYIDNFPDNLNIDAFFGGLGHNRSIQKFQISTEIGEDFKSLVPFLRNNKSLCDLTFANFDIGLQCARNIALLLGQQSTLNCLCFEDNNLGDEDFVEIATVLRTQPQIEELDFYANNIGRNGCVALRNMLEDMRNLNLATVDLGQNDIDDEGLHALVKGLRKCRKLKSLRLHRNQMITAAGLRSLSTLLQSEHCRLEHLTLSQNSFSVFGLRTLGTLAQRGTTLKSLWLRNNAINDEGLQSLVEGMTTRCSLTDLDLSYNDSITAMGLRTLPVFFQSDKCCLQKLWLWGINFGDEGAVALANGLMGNKSLTHVNFDSRGITSRGWAAFSKLLCDTASVNNTYLSNHTLVEIGGFMNVGNSSTIVGYLTLNKLQNYAAAICKILKNHPDIDVEPLFQWKLKCLPLVITWLEKAKPHMGYVNESTGTFQCRQLSALYKFVRGMPQLAVDGYRGKKMKNIQSKSNKRKLDQTL